MITGTIFKSLSGFYYVETENGTVRCEARGRFRHLGIKPLVGDKVEMELTEEDRGIINTILPRKNSFARPLVANVDQLVFVVSESVPVTDTVVLDRMIAMSESVGVEPVICINKYDLKQDDRLFSIYKNAGFTVVRMSAHTGEGMDTLAMLMCGKISALAGDTGVGKSSILNKLVPELELQTGEVSTKLGRGRHTTRHVEFYRLPGGGMVADTPGFASFDEETFQPEAEKVQDYFREFGGYKENCLFTGCAHIKEKGCAVLEAVENGEISVSRHKSYAAFYQEAKSHNSWEKKNQKK